MLEKAKAIHLKKNQDYTTNRDENPYENFDRANVIAAWFPDDYKSFAVLIGVKLARLGALLTQKRKPNNESLDDSFLDLVVYCILFYCFWRERYSGIQENQEGKTSIIFEASPQGLTPVDCGHVNLSHRGYCYNCNKYIPDAEVAKNYTWHQGLNRYIIIGAITPTETV